MTARDRRRQRRRRARRMEAWRANNTLRHFAERLAAIVRAGGSLDSVDLVDAVLPVISDEGA